MRYVKVYILIILFWFLMFNSPKVFAVNCDKTVLQGQSIQSAIDSAASNQTICVEYGIYTESSRAGQINMVDINKPGISLVGIPDSQGNLPVIDGEYARPSGSDATGGKCPGVIEGKQCYAVNYGKLVRIGANNVTIDGFELRRSLGQGLSVHDYRNNVYNPLTNITVKNVVIKESRGGGFQALDNITNLTFENNEVVRNVIFAPFSRSGHVLDWGGGVTVRGTNNISFKNNVIHENWGEGFIVDANVGGSSDITAVGNHIYDNYAVQAYFHAIKNVVFENNFVYHSTNPEFFRGGSASGCGVLTPSEPQYNQVIDTENVTLKNNVFAGCGVNYSFWGSSPGRYIKNAVLENNTLLNNPNSTYRNYSLDTSSVIESSSNNNISVGVVGTNPLGGDTNFVNSESAGMQSGLQTARGMSPKDFRIGSYLGIGANVDLIPDVAEVGPQTGGSGVPTPSTPTTPSPTSVYNPDFDVNKDGGVNIVDVLDLIRFLFK